MWKHFIFNDDQVNFYCTDVTNQFGSQQKTTHWTSIQDLKKLYNQQKSTSPRQAIKIKSNDKQ